MIVIDTAIAEARALGHNYVGTEHLLVALVQRRDLLPHQVGRMLPTEVQAVRAALEAEFDGPPRDEELLASLGIDLEGCEPRCAGRSAPMPSNDWRGGPCGNPGSRGAAPAAGACRYSPEEHFWLSRLASSE